MVDKSYLLLLISLPLMLGAVLGRAPPPESGSTRKVLMLPHHFSSQAGFGLKGEEGVEAF